MRRALAVLMLFASPLAAQETGLTIYQDGSVLVRRTLAQAVNRLTPFTMDLAAQAVEPGSFVVLDDGVTLRSVRILNVAGADAALRRSVGRDIDFRVQLRDTSYFVRGRLLSVEPFAVRIDGRVLYQMPGQPAFPDSLVQLTPRAEIAVASERPLQNLRIGYLTNGLSWRAQLNVVVPRVGGGPATVTGLAVIDNQGLTVRNAAVQLASGEIRRAAFQGPRPMAARAMASVQVEGITVEATNEAVAETRLYSLPERLDLEPGVTTSAALIAPATTQVERVLNLGPSNDIVDQWTTRADSNLHPDVSYVIKRPAGSAFGDQPAPQAVWRLLAPDSGGRLQLIGESQEPAMPAARDVAITTGTASDVLVDRIQTSWERRGDKDVVSAYRVTVHNAKDESITIAVNEIGVGRWEIQSSTVPAERVSSAQFRFLLPVPAHSDGVLEYRVRVRW